MGRKLDLSGLTDDEAKHVLQVVQRDMQLRKTEEARLSEMKQALVEEGSRSVLLARQHRFNERCCIRCCSTFTFLLKPRRSCLDCCYNVCKSCCTYSKKDKGFLCSACQKSRVLKAQSLEWFYNNVRRRFKRFGSAKVLKNLYRRRVAERGILAELTEGSTYEESTCNEGSVYESDSTFYRQSEERSMAETVSVALRVAEEAIDEAIAEAESQTDNQDKQNEAHYLRENRGELIEELATTIVQKIIRRRKDLSEMQSGSNLDLSPDQNNDRMSPVETQSPFNASLWRSRSAFSLLTDERVDQHGNIGSQSSASKGHALEMKKEGALNVQALPSWRSVDRLDNSMLQSPDGNWIAYQSTLLSRPSLLTKRKSLVYSVLERESGVVSAYDEMGSETEADADGVCGTALQELRRKISANNQMNEPQSYSRQSTLPLVARFHQHTTDTFNADAENSSAPSGQDGPLPTKSQKTLLPFLKRKVPLEHRRSSSSRRQNIMDVNFNPEGAESSEDGLEDSRVKRSRRRRKNKREEVEWKGQSTLSSTALQECSSQISDAAVKRRFVKQDSAFRERRLSDMTLEDDTSDTATPDILSSGAITPDPFGADVKTSINVNEDAPGVFGSLDLELTSKLKELTSQVSEIQLSSTEDELDRLGYQEDHAKKADEVIEDALLDMEVHARERSGETEATNQPWRFKRLDSDDLTSKLRELTSQVSETQLSSTEDELDRLEYQTETESVNQPMRIEILEPDYRTDDADVLKVADLARNDNEGAASDEVTLNYEILQETIQKQFEKERSVSTETEYSLAVECVDNEIELEKLQEEFRETEVDSEVQIKVTETTRLFRSKKNAEEMIEKAEEESTEKRQAGKAEPEQDISEQNDTMNKTQMPENLSSGSQKQTLADSDAQNETARKKAENTKSKRQVQTKEGRGEMQDFGSSVEGEQGRVEHTESVSLNKEQREALSNELPLSRFISEDGKLEFDRIIDSVVTTLNNMEEDIEAYTSEGVFLGREENEGEKQEITEKKAEEENIAKTEAVLQLDNTEYEPSFVGGGLKEIQEKEMKDESEMYEVDNKGTEEKDCISTIKSSQERVLEKEANNQADIVEKIETQKDKEPSTTQNPLQHSAPSGQEEYLSPEEIYKNAHMLDIEKNLHYISNILQKKYSAASLRSITTEVLKVLNATEDLIHGSMGDVRSQPDHTDVSAIPPAEARRLDEQLSRLEENVYVAAGTVYGLEAELGDLEECARSISGATSEGELAYLEDQVATAAAQVQQSELQVLDISARIAALKNAGLNVAPQTKINTTKTKTQTISSSRRLRRRLPAPPMQDKEA